MANGAISLWGSSQVMGNFFGQTVDYPGSMFMALVRDTAPDAFTEGGELDEPDSAAGYLRTEIINDASAWITDAEVVTNALDILFSQVLSPWGNIRYWALCNAAIEGQIYFYGDFGEVIFTETLDELVIVAGALAFVSGPIFSGVGDGS